MGTRLSFCAVVMAMLAAAFPISAAGQVKFVVRDPAGKVAGMFEYTHVMRPEGHFTSSQFFKGAKAVESRKGMKPVLRSHAQMNSDLHFDKYTRWETSGIDTTEYKVFKFKKDIKMRVAKGANGKVSVLGKVQPAYVIEPDQPHLALFFADPAQPERSVACINTKTNKIGHATVKCLGQADDVRGSAQEPAATPEPATAPDAPPPPSPPDGTAAAADQTPVIVLKPETPPAKVFHYSIAGDCGSFEVWFDDLGVMVKALSDKQAYEPIRQ